MLLAAIALAAVTTSPVDAEYLRLDEQLKKLTTTGVRKELAPELQSARDALNRGANASGAEYRLYRLRDAFVTVERIEYVVDHWQDDLQTLWNHEKPRFDKHETDRGSALERALAQSSATRADRYFEASLSYSKATNPLNGLYYLGEASANREFREFVRDLGSGAAEKTPTASQIASTLDALEIATLDFFSTRITTPDAIPVSARLKEARELLRAGRNEGAMLMAIEANIVLMDRGGAMPMKADSSTAPAGSMSSLLTEWVSNETQPERKTTREKAIAFYAGIFSPTQPVAAAKPQVVVTLVRWPYT